MVGISNYSAHFLQPGHYGFSIKDNVGFYQSHSIQLEELINLCGGIPIVVTNYSIEIIGMSEHVVQVRIKCDEFTTNRTLDFEDGIIHNDYMRVFDEGQGIGISLLVNQIQAATAKKFKSLEVHAAGGLEWTSDWKGHAFWAKTGYTMSPEYVIKFKKWIIDHRRTEANVFNLATDKKNGGYDLWYGEGFDLDGSFDLNLNSANRILLKKYLQMRGLNVNI
ncbi:MAG: hypothetical protein WDO19_03545 [Bacteroidota bacterium]